MKIYKLEENTFYHYFYIHYFLVINTALDTVMIIRYCWTGKSMKDNSPEILSVHFQDGTTDIGYLLYIDKIWDKALQK